MNRFMCGHGNVALCMFAFEFWDDYFSNKNTENLPEKREDFLSSALINKKMSVGLLMKENDALLSLRGTPAISTWFRGISLNYNRFELCFKFILSDF